MRQVVTADVKARKGDTKMKSALFFVIIAVSLMLSVGVWAQQPIGNEQVAVARFNDMASDTDWKVRTSNGGAKQKWLLHQVKVTKIAERLKAGESVDAREIEEILQEHSR